MSKLWKGVMVCCGAAVLTTVAATPATAGCVDPVVSPWQRTWTPRSGAAGKGVPAFSEGQGSVGRGADEDEEDASIVGFWQFAFTSEGNNVAPFLIPDGAPLDSGYAQWHSDQTEIMNSARDPATSNFCLGVWKQTGKRTYKLNHFALSWDNTGNLCKPEADAPSCLVGPANIREEVVLDRRGRSYSGVVTIDQYDNANHLMFRLTGTIFATRIRVD